MEINLNTISSMEDAYLYAVEKHFGQKRKFSDMPYIRHPEIVACITATYTEDKEMLQAALLHDTVEDTDATLDEIESLFGERVRDLVDELTNDAEQIKTTGKKVHMLYKFNSISSDALLIKLVDRLHNVIGLVNDNTPDDFTQWYIKETQYVLDNLDRELTKQQEELVETLQLVVNFIDLQLIYNNT